MDDQQHGDVARLLRGIAAQVGAAAPEGWRRAQVRACSRESGSGHSGSHYEMADGGVQDLRVNLSDELTRAYEVSGASLGDLTVELAVEPSGRFEALTSQAITRDRYAPDRFLYVLRPAFLPDEPGAEQDGPSDPTPAGDPDEAVRLFREYLAKRAEILGHEEALPAPLDAAERAELLDDFRVELPPDLLALYGEADGGEEIGLFHGHPWFGLESTTTHLHHYDNREWTDGPLWATADDSEPPGTVRRLLSSLKWIPFATSTGGDYLAVDMDPGPAGRPGQVVRVGRNYAGALHVADSVTTMLRRLVAALDRGDHWEDDGHLDVDVKIPSHLDPSGAHWRGEAPIPKKPRKVQRLIVDKVRDLDLTAVRDAPLLRQVVLFGEGPVDLRPLLDVPLEALRLHLDSVDLGQLAGHPTLRAVSLGTKQPVDLGPLRTLPRLQGLELSEAPVRDIGTIGDLEGLLTLTLTFEQWRELEKVPPLAAAGLSGDPTPGQLDGWATRFEPDELLGGHQYCTGRY